MEHDIIKNWFIEKKIDLDEELLRKIYDYVLFLNSENKKYNLTGFKTENEILCDLVLPSIYPIIKLNVPRGTFFADMGTGSGIPGIPIGIYLNAMNGILIDSNNKKISFVEKTIEKLNLVNLQTACGRIEEFGHDKIYRDKFNYVFARAMDSVYAVVELGSPFLSLNGLLYVYSNLKPADLDIQIVAHAECLGMKIVPGNEFELYGFNAVGLLFKKYQETDNKYPRRYSVIKRESNKLE